MLNRFEYAGRNDKKIKHYKFWQDGSEAKEITSASFLEQKIYYIHMNPVEAEWVDEPEYYWYSSARDYAGKRGLLKVIIAE